ncbi:PREDICTED: uncharacterized protein LOC109585533 [Amphimedon queenslandica]|uniref:USP domain-containing protein n=1 Tax=Amphimedon queenslandica TaxID=400682 RepID=A0AAN0JJL5_AMPQE|nr:PREDICTED: uncharacterized protein LOC109585533 [Amphimedon queenslandica]|eukprot:XP_019857220.1 PREDICTED: uncharacterized protein LOC109585533 [Amphimedon queenslandica]
MVPLLMQGIPSYQLNAIQKAYLSVHDQLARGQIGDVTEIAIEMGAGNKADTFKDNDIVESISWLLRDLPSNLLQAIHLTNIIIERKKTCSNCKKQVTEIDEIDVINCSIERNESSSVQDILSLRLEELLQTCTRAKLCNCKSADGDRTPFTVLSDIINLPNNLFVAINRTKPDSNSKLQKPILICDTPSLEGKAIAGTYKLQALAVHTGNSVKEGHFKVNVRDNDGWIVYDDMNVTRVTKANVNSRFNQKNSVLGVYCMEHHSQVLINHMQESDCIPNKWEKTHSFMENNEEQMVCL